MMHLYTRFVYIIMARQSITLTTPNDEWLKAQIESEEYMTKSEVVNDLIRRARERESQEMKHVQAKLMKAEKTGFTKMNSHQILEESKKQMRQNGEL